MPELFDDGVKQNDLERELLLFKEILKYIYTKIINDKQINDILNFMIDIINNDSIYQN